MSLRRKKGCNMSKWKKGLAITAGSFTLIAVGASLAGGNDSTSSTPAKHDRTAATSQAATATTPEQSAQSTTVEQPAETSGQENARESAESYLSMGGFSRSGLIDQLKYEGFSKKDAKYAVDALGADWNKQAVMSAESYLDMGGFSRSALVEQLVYEGFTQEQAEYGVKKAY
jgi:hypothetical protein